MLDAAPPPDPFALPVPSRCIFIAGCQRSGTTLLRLILECHSQIFCFDETLAYSVIQKQQLPAPINKQTIALKIPRWTEQFNEPIWSDWGLPETTPNRFQGQKLVFLVRDPVEVVASMLSLKSGRESWLELHGEPILEDKARNPRFVDEWRDELAIRAASGPHRLTATGTLYWKYKNAAILRYSRLGYPFLVVSYARLVSSPETQIRRICAFLELEFEEGLLRHHQASHAEIYGDGTTVGGTDSRRPIDTASVGKNTFLLGNDEIRLIHTIVGDLPAQLAGYF
jgi:Sulfotransferase domain